MTRTQLRLPTPCSESWAAMTPTGPGRHCAACQKTVVDFTQQTDAEILAYLARAASTPCGRFRAGQLGRSLQPTETASRWRAWLSALLALGSLGTGLAPKATAQTIIRGTAGPVPTNTTSTATHETVAATSGQPLPATSCTAPSLSSQPMHNQLSGNGLVEIRGLVRDAQCVPLPGVVVLVKGTAAGTSTNLQGEFNLTLPPTEQPVQLVIRFVGYTVRERTVTAAAATHRVEVVLEEEVVGQLLPSYRPPWPWYPRAFYFWGKYWLTRPFRHYSSFQVSVQLLNGVVETQYVASGVRIRRSATPDAK